MKTKKVLIAALFALFALGFASCNDDDDDVSYINIEFEDAQLGGTGYVNNVSYAENGVTFTNNFNETYSSWTGFAISNKVDKETAGYSNQYSVYATSGAAGSANFAVGFYGAYNDERPTMAFAAGVEHQIVSAYLCLTTYTYKAIVDGDDGYGGVRQFCLDSLDLYTLVATGYDCNATQTGELSIKLADYTGTTAVLFDNWAKVDLTVLGKVNKVTFKLTSTDTGAWGINTPTYFAIDNVKFED